MLVGRSWRDRWEDGEEGIWRASDTRDVVVAKAAELNDPALCDASTAGSIWNRAAIKILGNSQLSLAKDSALTTATTSIAPLMDEDTMENKETSSVLHEIFGDGPVASKAKGKDKGGSSIPAHGIPGFFSWLLSIGQLQCKSWHVGLNTWPIPARAPRMSPALQHGHWKP